MPGHPWLQAQALASRRRPSLSGLAAQPGNTAGVHTAAPLRADQARLTARCAQSRVVSTLPQRVDLYFERRPLRRYMCARPAGIAASCSLSRGRAQVVWHQRLFGLLRGQHGVAVLRRVSSERHSRRRSGCHLRRARYACFLRGVAESVRAAAVYKRRKALIPSHAAPFRCGSCIASRCDNKRCAATGGGALRLLRSPSVGRAQLGFVYALISDSFKLGG